MRRTDPLKESLGKSLLYWQANAPINSFGAENAKVVTTE
jgi:hypothetical protein